MLRVATRAAHDRVDAIFSTLDLADPADYRCFLSAQAAAFLPLERALDVAGADALFPDWSTRRRADALRADLEALGIAAPRDLPSIDFATPGEVAGGAYVLEGSRLGGALLARQVGPNLPTTFLASPQLSGQWRIFLSALEQALVSPVHHRQAIDGAVRSFDFFARAGTLVMEQR